MTQKLLQSNSSDAGSILRVFLCCVLNSVPALTISVTIGTVHVIHSSVLKIFLFLAFPVCICRVTVLNYSDTIYKLERPEKEVVEDVLMCDCDRLEEKSSHCFL